jgi:hypothetical protein
LDSGNPAITLANDAGANYASRLGSWSNPQTGVYTIPYTSTSSDALEGLHWMVSGTVNSKNRLYPAYTQIVDTIAVDFTSTDRANLGFVLTQATAAASQATNAASQTTLAAIQGAVGLTSANLNSQFTTVASAISALPTVSEIQNGLATSANVTGAETTIIAAMPSAPSASAVATAVAALILKTPGNQLATNSDGSVVVDANSVSINNYFTVPAAIAQASQTPSQITCLRGDTLSVALPLMGNISGRTRLLFTAKQSFSDPDSAAILQVIEGVGLTILNGSNMGLTAGDASLTVTNATTGAVTLVVGAVETAKLVPQDLAWDCQVHLPNTNGIIDIITPIGGSSVNPALMSIVGDVTLETT